MVWTEFFHNITTQNTEFKMDSWVQFMEVKNNTDFDDSEQSKILIIPSFGDVKFNQMRYECFTETKTQTQDVLTNNSIYNGSFSSSRNRKTIC